MPTKRTNKEKHFPRWLYPDEQSKDWLDGFEEGYVNGVHATLSRLREEMQNVEKKIDKQLVRRKYS